MDLLVLQLIIDEIKKTMINARLVDVLQPDQQTVVFRFTNDFYVLYCINPNVPQLYLFQPDEKPQDEIRNHFRQPLEHHLLGAHLTKCETIAADRIAKFYFAKTDKVGIETKYQLVFEIIGRACNLILIETDHTIIDCFNRTENKERRLLPQETYELPSPPPGVRLKNLTLPIFQEKLIENSQKSIRSVLLRTIREFSPQIIDEILFKVEIDPKQKIECLSDSDQEAIFDKIMLFYEKIEQRDFQAGVVTAKSGEAVALSAFPLSYLGGEYRLFSTMNEAADFYYRQIQQQQLEQQLRRKLHGVIQKGLKKTEKLKNQLRKDLDRAENADEYRIMGEILTTNLYRVKSGMSEITAPNYYNAEQRPITISLDPKLSPQKNAERYFRKYRKARDGREVIAGRFVAIKKQVREWLLLKEELENAMSIADLKFLEEKLIDIGEIKPKRTFSPVKREEEVIRPRRFVTSDGWEVFVGRNNKENDLLTRRIAHKNDIWLHAQGAAGAHVILSRKGRREISPKALQEAAEIAAFFSKAKHSSYVPVIYTERRFVRKPRGAAPGQVTCINEKTIFVTPKRPTGDDHD